MAQSHVVLVSPMLQEFRMELWTYKPVPAGHELLICYGEPACQIDLGSQET